MAYQGEYPDIDPMGEGEIPDLEQDEFEQGRPPRMITEEQESQVADVKQGIIDYLNSEDVDIKAARQELNQWRNIYSWAKWSDIEEAINDREVALRLKPATSSRRSGKPLTEEEIKDSVSGIVDWDKKQTIKNLSKELEKAIAKHDVPRIEYLIAVAKEDVGQAEGEVLEDSYKDQIDVAKDLYRVDVRLREAEEQKAAEAIKAKEQAQARIEERKQLKQAGKQSVAFIFGAGNASKIRRIGNVYGSAPVNTAGMRAYIGDRGMSDYVPSGMKSLTRPNPRQLTSLPKIGDFDSPALARATEPDYTGLRASTRLSPQRTGINGGMPIANVATRKPTRYQPIQVNITKRRQVVSNPISSTPIAQVSKRGMGLKVSANPLTVANRVQLPKFNIQMGNAIAPDLLNQGDNSMGMWQGKVAFRRMSDGKRVIREDAYVVKASNGRYFFRATDDGGEGLSRSIGTNPPSIKKKYDTLKKG